MPIAGSQIIPSARYKDAYAAIAWLCKVFGFVEQAVYGDGTTVDHAQLRLGQGMFMLGSEQKAGHNEYANLMATLEETGGRDTVGLCLVVEDCEAVYGHAVAAGAEIVQPLHNPEYGGQAFACRDLEGHVWWVGTYNPWAHAGEAAEGTA